MLAIFSYAQKAKLYHFLTDWGSISDWLCRKKKEDVDTEYTEGAILNSDTLSTENVRNWLNTTDTSYTFGQGNDLMHDWTPKILI